MTSGSSKQQHRIYEKLATTNKALESTSDAIILADNEGVAIYSNPAFISLLGYSVHELNVSGIPEALFQKPNVGRDIFNAVRQHGSWKGEVELRTKNGEIIPFLLNLDSITDQQDELIGFISICTDISYHKHINSIQQKQHMLAEAQLDTTKVLTSTLDLAEVFERILDNIGYVVPNDAANIVLIHEGKAQLVDGDDYADKPQIEVLKSGQVAVQEYDDLRTILETDKPLVISRTQQYTQERSNLNLHTPWLNSHIGIPIRLHEKVIGFLNVDSILPGLFTQEHAEQLAIFAEQAAIAIHNARLHESAQKLAVIEERQRLARNLHDAVSQLLFSASIIAEALPQLWEKKPHEVFPRLEQIRNLNRSALAEMRTLLLELHPERLLETEISQLMQQLVVGILGQTRLGITLDVTQDLVLGSAIHEAIYYITQEALNNVVKHANASLIAIQLYEEHDCLTLTIRDNGRGFDPQEVIPTSLGLNNIQERARSTQGKLDITNDKGEGTLISVCWLNSGGKNIWWKRKPSAS